MKAKFSRRGHFNRDRLPRPGKYYTEQGLKLTGGAEWKSALCPFHNDTEPSLRIRLDAGCFCCMACGVKGGDVVAFHMRRYKLSFIATVRALGAWEGE